MSEVPAIRMRLADTIGEALSAAAGRPGRTLLTALGTVLGVGLLVLTLGLTASTGGAVNRDFNALISTEVDATAPPAVALAMERPAPLARARSLHGLIAAGPLLVPAMRVTIAHDPPRPGDAGADAQISLIGASPQSLRVIGPRLAGGRSYGAGAEAMRAHVALIGSDAARILGMRGAALPWWVTIEGQPFLIEGVIGGTERHSEALLSIVIPYATALSLRGISWRPPSLIAATRLGYTEAVAAALPAALHPTEPAAVSAGGLPEPTLLRSQVSGSITALFALLAGVGMIVGMVGIGNAAVVSVMERTAEIGLRRALGARRGQIATQFLLESLAIGALGGILGVCLGVIALVAVTLVEGWTAVLPLWVPAAAPLAGALTGLLAGLYPALRAAGSDPVAALAR